MWTENQFIITVFCKLNTSSNPSQKINVHKFYTRNKNNLVVPSSRLQKTRGSFLGKCICMFNKVPQNVIDLPVNKFEIHLKNILMSEVSKPVLHSEGIPYPSLPSKSSKENEPQLLELEVEEAFLSQDIDFETLPRPEELKSFCSSEDCVWSTDAFKITEWRVLTGNVTSAGHLYPQSAPTTPSPAGILPSIFLLDPDAEIELEITFSPAVAVPLVTYLYLRNNFTVVEVFPLAGRGAHPSFELGGRRPGSAAPIVFEVAECPATGAGVRRQLAVRNTGPVPLHLRDWRLAGRPCAARGFRLHPCAPLALAPNETRTLRLTFHPDYTLARVLATLTVRADAARAEFRLRAALPARLLRACAIQNPPPPFDPPLRAAGAALALAALALVLAAAALDAERALRRARHARLPVLPPARAPLDLRAAADVPPPPPPPPRRRRAPRRPPPPDPRAPLAERRAFERWRAEVLRRAEREDEHLSEDGTHSTPPPPAPPASKSPERKSPLPEDDEADVPRPSSDDAGPSGDSSVSSDSSPGDDLEGRDDSEPDARATPVVDSPGEPAESPDAESPPRRPDPRRDPRPRRDPSDQIRRPDRRALDAGEGRPRPAPSRLPGRRDKGGRRRVGERASGPPSCSPPAAVPEVRAPAAVRWGASWSSVVAAGASAGAPLPPIGSDVRRRPEERTDQSLFYFNGEQPPPQPPERFPWRASPPLDRPRYPPPVNDYIGDFDEPNTYGSVWAGGAWAWGGGLGVRPPPGFGAPTAPPAPRAYDPFRSLATIWAPGALDWRTDPTPASALGPGPGAVPEDSRPDD
ncbi:unnamed protein product [Diatraea saccharalis]|uniref:TMEM131L fifth Ig-like domain-containing protein n=1 Tax=Diatraea saccharalis TaxID=40085 RepID=A0A9N9N0Y9_9NEOP|nr:unnamed protein product [Diatraea saccharalis]